MLSIRGTLVGFAVTGVQHGQEGPEQTTPGVLVLTSGVEEVDHQCKPGSSCEAVECGTQTQSAEC